MIAWFTRNSVAANLLMFSILMSGIVALTRYVPLEVFPSIDPNTISIRVTLRGATPEDVEQGITMRMEEAIQDLEGIEQITSRSSEGSAVVSIEVETGYDPRELLADVKSRVDSINTLPIDAERPIVELAIRKQDVISVVVTSEYGERETREFAERVRVDLLRNPAITQLELSGIRTYEIAAEVSQDSLRQYGLTLTDISNAISAFSVDVSAGNLRTHGGDILIRSTGQAYHRDEFANIVVKTRADGSQILLGDIATVTDGFEEVGLSTRFNGKQAAFIEVYRVGSQSAIGVADEVKKYIDDMQSQLPEGFGLSYWDDDSQIVKNRINTLATNAWQGGILVLLLLTMFLRPAIAFWVFIGIPVSFMGAFIALPIFDTTLNIISLFAFIVVLGIVVDDAIVTGENIYTHLKKSASGEDAAINGTLEVSVPVTFGVLTTVVAFLPLAFIDGVRGAIFGQIPVVVIPVLLFSLIESKFVLPSHLKHLKTRGEKEDTDWFSRRQRAFADGFERLILKYYQPMLAMALRHKLSTILAMVGLLAIMLSVIMTGWMRFVFFPRVPSETVRVNITMPAGTPFEVTNAHVSRISDIALQMKERHTDPVTGESVILNILARAGGSAENTGRVRFEIMPPELRTNPITATTLLNEWRKEIGEIPGAESMAFRAEIGRASDPIDVQLTGSSLETLEEIADKIKVQLGTYPVVFDIVDSLSDGKEELQVELTEQGIALGLTRSGIARQVRGAFFGSEVQRVQRGRDDVRVMVRLPLSERRSIADLSDILIQTPSGVSAPLSHVARLIPGRSPSTIYRIDQFRTVNVRADIDKATANMTVINEELSTFIEETLLQYPGVSYSLEGEAKEQRQSFSSLGVGLVIVLFLIYSLLAIPLKSYSKPLVVMSVIPFGLIGAILGHMIMGMSPSIMSMMGMLALTGVVVNDSLVLVDFINKHRSEWGNVYEAVLQAGAARFRPVMLTSLTTFFGLMPLLFEKQTQAQFLIPMAISLGFGILFATLITLVLVPVNYVLGYEIRQWFRYVFGSSKTSTEGTM